MHTHTHTQAGNRTQTLTQMGIMVSRFLSRAGRAGADNQQLVDRCYCYMLLSDLCKPAFLQRGGCARHSARPRSPQHVEADIFR